MKKFLLICLFFSVNLSADTQLKVLSTTSTRDSGLYDYIIPYFEEKFDIEVSVIATGTGHAINNAKQCNGDILITHAKTIEEDFVKKGYGSSRSDLMYNDFVVVGPMKDPTNIKNSNKVSEVFDKIKNSQTKFVSRGDESGTHLSELRIWNNAISSLPNA